MAWNRIVRRWAPSNDLYPGSVPNPETLEATDLGQQSPPVRFGELQLSHEAFGKQSYGGKPHLQRWTPLKYERAGVSPPKGCAL